MSCRAQDEVDDLFRAHKALQSKVGDLERELANLQRVVSLSAARLDWLEEPPADKPSLLRRVFRGIRPTRG